jgi:hypothetical protein
MTDEEREDFMDDLLFPPYSCWDDNTEDNDE